MAATAPSQGSDGHSQIGPMAANKHPECVYGPFPTHNPPTPSITTCPEGQKTTCQRRNTKTFLRGLDNTTPTFLLLHPTTKDSQATTNRHRGQPCGVRLPSQLQPATCPKQDVAVGHSGKKARSACKERPCLPPARATLTLVGVLIIIIPSPKRATAQLTSFELQAAHATELLHIYADPSCSKYHTFMSVLPGMRACAHAIHCIMVQSLHKGAGLVAVSPHPPYIHAMRPT